MRFDYKKFAQSRVLVGIAFLVVGILIIFLLSLQNKGAIKPEPDEEDIARNIALIYNSEELYKLLDDNETTISLIRKDLRFFALTTSKNVADDPVVGFTFTKGPTQEGDSYVFEGLFYDIDGKIRLVLNKLKTGVVRLSITNMKTQTNIDEFLQLNGPRNRLIASFL